MCSLLNGTFQPSPVGSIRCCTVSLRRSAGAGQRRARLLAREHAVLPTFTRPRRPVVLYRPPSPSPDSAPISSARAGAPASCGRAGSPSCGFARAGTVALVSTRSGWLVSLSRAGLPAVGDVVLARSLETHDGGCEWSGAAGMPSRALRLVCPGWFPRCIVPCRHGITHCGLARCPKAVLWSIAGSAFVVPALQDDLACRGSPWQGRVCSNVGPGRS